MKKKMIKFGKVTSCHEWCDMCEEKIEEGEYSLERWIVNITTRFGLCSSKEEVNDATICRKCFKQYVEPYIKKITNQL